jgi:hypothetical protein
LVQLSYAPCLEHFSSFDLAQTIKFKIGGPYICPWTFFYDPSPFFADLLTYNSRTVGLSRRRRMTLDDTYITFIWLLGFMISYFYLFPNTYWYSIWAQHSGLRLMITDIQRILFSAIQKTSLASVLASAESPFEMYTKRSPTKTMQPLLITMTVLTLQYFIREPPGGPMKRWVFSSRKLRWSPNDVASEEHENKMRTTIKKVQLSLQWRQLQFWYNHNPETMRRNKLHLQTEDEYIRRKYKSKIFHRWNSDVDCDFFGWISGWEY